MSASGWFVFAIIVLAIVVVFYNQFQELIVGATTLGQQTAVNANLQINPVNGQTVCNLKLTLQPNLVALPAVGQGINTALIGGIAGWSLPNGASYSWTNCHQYANPLSMSWIPLQYIGGTPTMDNGLGSLSTNDILLTAGQTVHLNLTVISGSGGQRSYTTDPLCLQFCTSVSIPAGTVFVPKQYTFTFVITNLPRQNYQIQINSELGFNGNSAGVPYLQKVTA